MTTLILGGGLAGLSASYHIGHGRCLILEKQPRPFGHARSRQGGGFTWDEGPHVSFTSSPYVQELFAEAVGGEYEQLEIRAANWFKGGWIGHPAQSNLYQAPEPLRGECLKSFLETRAAPAAEPANYAEWLEQAFGPVFARTFPAAYTRKYWTVEPARLSTGWVGKRVFRPSVADVTAGARGPLPQSTYYITRARYPKRGGYQSFAQGLAKGANLLTGQEVVRVELKARRAHGADGRHFDYERLISTLPLPEFIGICADVPAGVKEAAARLDCSRLLLVSVELPHPARRPENWLYVYDEDFYSTRIHFTEKLAPGNAPEGRSGLQAEVYFGRHRPRREPVAAIAAKVVRELAAMKLIDGDVDLATLKVVPHEVPWGNVIFDLDCAPAMQVILSWLEEHGLQRQADDGHPLTGWSGRGPQKTGRLALAGRYGAWKYYWTDDCVLNGKALAEGLGPAGN